MIASALIGLTMAAQVPSSLMARSDEAAATYVPAADAAKSELFTPMYLLSAARTYLAANQPAVVRQANAAHLPQAAFEQRFAASCRAEEQAQHALGVRVLRLRGEPAPERSADALDRQIRQGMIDEYRTLPEKQRMLEQIAALCRANPQECR